MRFSLLVAAFVGLVAGQSSAESSHSASIIVASSASVAPTTTAPLTPLQTCLNACAAGDVNCQAICVGVPHPGSAQINLTTDCVAKCDQGDGSTAASQAYGRCRDACISSYIITSGTAAPGGAYTTAIPPGVSHSTMMTSVTDSANNAGSSSVHTGSATGTAPLTVSTGAAAPRQVELAAGALGLAMAGFAML